MKNSTVSNILIKLSVFSLLIFIGCDKNNNKFFSDKEKYSYPMDFIVPNTTIDIQIDEKTNEILEVLTHQNLYNLYNSCYDNNGKPCNGTESISIKMFFNFTDKDKEISFLTEYGRNCEYKRNQALEKKIETISLNPNYAIEKKY